MPDPQGRTQVFIPGDEVREIVMPTQRRVFEETGEWLTTGLAVRYLMKIGFATDSSQEPSHLSSAAN